MKYTLYMGKNITATEPDELIAEDEDLDKLIAFANIFAPIVRQIKDENGQVVRDSREPAR